MSLFSELLSAVVAGLMFVLLVGFLAGNLGYLVRGLFRMPGKLFSRPRAHDWQADD